MSDLRPESLTWTSLLAQWMRFAQASLAIPEENDGVRWRASVPAIINLQAVTFALAELHQLPVDERALGIDKAQILIEKSEADLDRTWQGRDRSPMLIEIVSDARQALRAATGIS
jgi:hypothetical protein